jgi:ankyrin repeat protein
VVPLLVAARADLYTADSKGSTPLFRAINDGHTEVAALLIVAGASVDGTDPV